MIWDSEAARWLRRRQSNVLWGQRPHRSPSQAAAATTHLHMIAYIECEAHEVGAAPFVDHVVQLELADEVQRDDEGWRQGETWVTQHVA